MCIKGIQLSSLSVLATLTQSSPSLVQDHFGSQSNRLQRVPMHGTHSNPSLENLKQNPQPSPRGSVGSTSSSLQWRKSSAGGNPALNRATDNTDRSSGRSKPLSRSTPSFDPFAVPAQQLKAEQNPRQRFSSSIAVQRANANVNSQSSLQVATRSPQLKEVDRSANRQDLEQVVWRGSPTRPDQLLPDEKQSNSGSDSSHSSSSSEEMTLAPPELSPPSIEGLSSADEAKRQIPFSAPGMTPTPTHSALTPPQIAELPELPDFGHPEPLETFDVPSESQLSLPSQKQNQEPDQRNPFPARAPKPDQNGSDSLRSRLAEDQSVRESSKEYGSGIDYLSETDFSCEEFRDRIASQTIDQISLDISPPFRPDEFDERRHEELFADFLEKQPIRDWSTLDGTPVINGRLIDLAYEEAVIELDNGQKRSIPMSQLSEGDLAHINDTWGLPRECLIEQVSYQPRQWAPTKVTWTASNLCHNPRYFESVNLERYGHTRGPLLEPVVQSAHFFGNIFILPYKMGVHGPRECQYALGYYRPGNDAPWIKQPLPISARGAIAQAATMTGLFWLIP